jgi:hypothetical protein
VNQILKSVVREIRTLRSVGVGASSGCPFYPAELEMELVATTPALYSTESLNTTFLTGGIWKKEGFFL